MKLPALFTTYEERVKSGMYSRAFILFVATLVVCTSAKCQNQPWKSPGPQIYPSLNAYPRSKTLISKFINSVWIVFAARILLDLKDIVGEDISRGYLEQKAAGDQAVALLGFKVERGQLNPRGERWRTKDAPNMLALWKLLQYWVTTPTFPLMKQRWLAEKANIVGKCLRIACFLLGSLVVTVWEREISVALYRLSTRDNLTWNPT